jgi:hypothetical protein
VTFGKEKITPSPCCLCGNAKLFNNPFYIAAIFSDVINHLHAQNALEKSTQTGRY